MQPLLTDKVGPCHSYILLDFDFPTRRTVDPTEVSLFIQDRKTGEGGWGVEGPTRLLLVPPFFGFQAHSFESSAVNGVIILKSKRNWVSYKGHSKPRFNIKAQAFDRKQKKVRVNVRKLWFVFPGI